MLCHNSSFAIPAVFVTSVDDGISELISVNKGFPLGHRKEYTVHVGTYLTYDCDGCCDCFTQVGTNGYFTFSNFTGFTPFPFSGGNSLSLVAPFFADWDISDGSGSITYQMYDHFNSTLSRTVVEEINNEINLNKKHRNFSAQWLLIAKWDNVTLFGNYNTVSICPSLLLFVFSCYCTTESYLPGYSGY